MKEYLAICGRVWSAEEPVNFSGQHYRIEDGRSKTPFVAPGRRVPEIYVGGASTNAREAASALADCWLRFADTPENVARDAAAMRLSGTEVGFPASLGRRAGKQ